jgi:hypothetical protein
MRLEEFALRIGLSKEVLIILLIQAAIAAITVALGVGVGVKDGKVPT